jgi:8-oxo-dGTP diphosphatase
VDRPHIVVTAAVIERDGRFLVTRRPRGSHLEGCWEFAGGKCDPGEALDTCLEREIAEELDARVRVGGEIYSVTHAYPERIVELHFFTCEIDGEPRAMLGQEMQWVERERLSDLEFPPADAELIAILMRAPEARTASRSPSPAERRPR